MAKKRRPMLGVEPGWLVSVKHRNRPASHPLPLFADPFGAAATVAGRSTLGGPISARLQPGDIGLVICIIDGGRHDRRMFIVSVRGLGWAFANDDTSWRVICEKLSVKQQ